MERNEINIREETDRFTLKEDEKVLAAICYPAMITFIVPLVIYLTQPPEKKSLRFHALQGLTAHLAFLALYLVLFFIVFILSFLTFGIGAALGVPLILLVFFGYFGLSFYWAYKVYSGEKLTLPYITEFVLKNFRSSLD